MCDTGDEPPSSIPDDDEWGWLVENETNGCEKGKSQGGKRPKKTEKKGMRDKRKSPTRKRVPTYQPDPSVLTNFCKHQSNQVRYDYVNEKDCAEGSDGL